MRNDHRRGRRSVLLVGVAIGVVLAVAAVLLLVNGDGDKEETWNVLPESPLAGRFFPATAWTGQDMVIWGGGSCSGDFCNSAIARPLADGAGYNPATNTWRPIAASPLSGRLRPATVWTGREMLVWGGNREDTALADGAAYDPIADRWRMLAPAPTSGRFGAAAVYTGTELLIWGGGEGGQTARTNFGDGAAYNPETDTWRPLPSAPIVARSAVADVATWTGREFIVWGGFAGEESLGDGAAYDPQANRWRRLSPAPIEPRATQGRWTGTELVVWGGGQAARSLNDGAAYNPQSDSWRVLPESPLQPRRAFASAWTGKEFLVWGGGPDNSLVFYGSGAAYDPTADRWRDIPGWNARFGPASAWTGKEFLIWGGIYAPVKIEVLNDGARYTP